MLLLWHDWPFLLTNLHQLPLCWVVVILTVWVSFFTDRWELDVGHLLLVMVLFCVHDVRGFFLEGFFWVFNLILVYTHFWFRMKWIRLFFLLLHHFVFSVVGSVIFGWGLAGVWVGFLERSVWILLDLWFVVLCISSSGSGPDDVKFFGRKWLKLILEEDHPMLFLDFAKDW